MTTYSIESQITTTHTLETQKGSSFLLKEDAFYLLLENGSKIVLSYGIDYTLETPATTTYTLET